MPNKNELESKQFRLALAQMQESELARLLDRIEILVQDFQLIPLRECESVAVVADAQKALKIWNAEVRHILKVKHHSDLSQNEVDQAAESSLL